MTERPVLEQQTLALAGLHKLHALSTWQQKRVAGRSRLSRHRFIHYSASSPKRLTYSAHPQGIRLGLEQLSACLRMNQDSAAADTLRYTMAMLQLERKFSVRDDMQSVIHSRLKHTAYKAENFSSDIRGLSANISAIYQDTLSHLSYRIKVTGSAQHLNNPQVAGLVRAVLLCGVRELHSCGANWAATDLGS